MSAPSEPAIHTYELPNTGSYCDYSIFRHSNMCALLTAILAKLEGLADGESVTITYRVRSQEQMDELYDDG